MAGESGGSGLPLRAVMGIVAIAMLLAAVLGDHVDTQLGLDIPQLRNLGQRTVILVLALLLLVAVLYGEIRMTLKALCAAAGTTFIVLFSVIWRDSGNALEPLHRTYVVDTDETSKLPDADGITYDLGNTIDGSSRTAWNGDATGIGVRAEKTEACRIDGYVDTDAVDSIDTPILQWRFKGPVHIDRLGIENGYRKDGYLYAANHRLKELEVRTEKGVGIISLEDIPSWQHFDLDSISGDLLKSTRYIEFEVLSIYRGTGRERNGKRFTRGADIALT